MAGQKYFSTLLFWCYCWIRIRDPGWEKNWDLGQTSWIRNTAQKFAHHSSLSYSYVEYTNCGFRIYKKIIFLSWGSFTEHRLSIGVFRNFHIPFFVCQGKY